MPLDYVVVTQGPPRYDLASPVPWTGAGSSLTFVTYLLVTRATRPPLQLPEPVYATREYLDELRETADRGAPRPVPPPTYETAMQLLGELRRVVDQLPADQQIDVMSDVADFGVCWWGSRG